MTGDTFTTADRSESDERRLLRTLIAALLLTASIATVAMMTPAGVATVAANETNDTNGTNVSDEAPYYANQTPSVKNESWMDGRENATLDNVFHYASRFGTFVIGSGSDSTNVDDPRSAGPLLVGVVLLGAIMGTAVGSGVGSVGGGVLSMVGLFGLVAVDVAPTWVYAVGLFGLGIVLSAVFKRAVR